MAKSTACTQKLFMGFRAGVVLFSQFFTAPCYLSRCQTLFTLQVGRNAALAATER